MGYRTFSVIQKQALLIQFYPLIIIPIYIYIYIYIYIFATKLLVYLDLQDLNDNMLRTRVIESFK